MSTVTCTNCEESVVGIKEGSIINQPIAESIIEWNGIPVAGFGYGWTYPTKYDTLTLENNSVTPSPVPITTDTFMFLLVSVLATMLLKSINQRGPKWTQ